MPKRFGRLRGAATFGIVTPPRISKPPLGILSVDPEDPDMAALTRTSPRHS